MVLRIDALRLQPEVPRAGAGFGRDGKEGEHGTEDAGKEGGGGGEWGTAMERHLNPSDGDGGEPHKHGLSLIRHEDVMWPYHVADEADGCEHQAERDHEDLQTTVSEGECRIPCTARAWVAFSGVLP